MFNIELIDTPFEALQTDAKIVFVGWKNFTHQWIKDKETLELMGFKGESEEAIFIPSSKREVCGM